MICRLLNLTDTPIDLSDWEKIIETIKNPKDTVTIGLVGKYVQHQDAYKSILEALEHSAIALGYKLDIKLFEADKILKNDSVHDTIEGCDGYLVPGGFGERGWLGKISTAKYCRENQIPFFGICLGMQVMAVEFARHVANIEDANSTEIDPSTTNPIIGLLSEQNEIQDKGGTMRLGNFDCTLLPGTKAHKAYANTLIGERHRHRYEFNNKYRQSFEKQGLVFAGTLANGNLCEIIEVRDHPWMVGVQFHPEFKSKPTLPHPLFKDFIQAAIDQHSKSRQV